MSQTLYIETNEEITSIIDRAKSVKDSEIVLVIPKKAAILQSILNLKILKKQFDRQGKTVVIVTSDNLGRNLASRADFIVKQKLERESVTHVARTETRESLGETDEDEISPREIRIQKGESKSTPNRLRVSDIIRKGNDDIFMKIAAVKEEKHQDNSDETDTDKEEVETEKSTKISALRSMILRDYEESLPSQKVVLLPNFGKRLLIIVGVFTLLVVGIVLFLVLPTASIAIEPKTQLITQDLDLAVDKDATEVNKSELKIPGVFIEVAKETNKEFDATGKKQVKEKASGIITVYNEWDSKSQTLVESTRFLSENGKLFRSTKTVVVPGFKREQGKDITGSIIVPVVADEAGEGSNIKASRFSIPGLKGTVKYEKIYGVTTESMTGGEIGEITVVSEDDLSKAKKSLEQGLRDELVAEIKSKSEGQSILIDNAIFINKANFSSSKKLGEEAKSFSLTLKLSGSAMTFQEQHVLDLVKDTLKAPFDKYLLIDDPKLAYGEANADTRNGKMNIKVYAETVVASKIDKDSIVNNIKGKNTEELREYFANVNEVSNVDVKFWPSWVKSIPHIDNKVNVDIK